VAALTIQGTGFQGGVREKDILAYLEKNGGAAAPAAAPAPAAFATPLARKIAAAEGVDIASAIGSGPYGKITKDDVLKALRSAAASGALADEREATDIADDLGFNGDKKIGSVTPYSGVRKIIGERLAESKFTAPHLYFTQKVDLSDLLSLRKLVNEKQDKKTSVTDYIAKAAVIALLKYPDMNSSLVGDSIEQYANVNLGIAVASTTGLIVPVIKDAQDMSVVEISKAASPLFDKAREGKLLPGEYTGGTFTISNLGMFGIENFTAIINPPEVGILAISSTKDEPTVVLGADGGKSIEIRPIMNITLSVDHRLIDGLLAAQFVTEVKRLLESPIELLI
jgi:pyruvate dehydrogenase E2 component (dihydrolipoamide acetyltransferase)